MESGLPFALATAVSDVFASGDLLVTPTVAVGPVPGGTVGPDHVVGRATNPSSDWQLMWPFDFTGHPTTSGLTGFVDGMQAVSPRHDDADVPTASATFERERPWLTGGER